jgi:hypothetical protein
MNAVISGMQSLGIAEADLKTSNYNLSPRYDYDVSPATIAGYEASQRLTVKVRNTDIVGSVLAKAGDLGATAVGSLRFEVDDETAALQVARQDAIAKAYAQAADIAQAMGVNLNGVVSYSESTGGAPNPYPSYAESLQDASAVPVVEGGSTEIMVTVSMTYAIDGIND